MFGFLNPVLIDADGTIIAGHGRVRAAKLLGWKVVPTIRVEHLTSAQVRAYVIADNKLAELSEWDEDLLSLGVQEVIELDPEFDLGVLGFEVAELDILSGTAIQDEEPDPADELADVEASGPAVSRSGDLWRIGLHRLLCADALDGAAYVRLLGNEAASLVFTDPPYNVAIGGNVSGLGRHRHAEFAMASGEMSSAQFQAFLATALGHHVAHSRDGALHFVCIDWRHAGDLLVSGSLLYSELKNLCVWVKTNGGMGSLYRSQHELVHVFKVGTAPHTNNVALGRHGRSRSNVWRYAGANSFGRDRDQALAMHPTTKPVRLVADAILDASRPGEIILDGFAGSGTTLLAAERTGRRGFGIEIEPHFVDVAIRRLAEHAGLEAVHAQTGLTFEAVEAARTLEGAAESERAPDGDEAFEEEPS